jgi:phage-related protein
MIAMPEKTKKTKRVSNASKSPKSERRSLFRELGPGVHELRIHASVEHRVLYVTKFSEAIYVLHAFQKKKQRTPSGTSHSYDTRSSGRGLRPGNDRFRSSQ